MKKIVYSSRAKKDLKKYKNALDRLRSLFAVLDMLAQGQALPAQFSPHPLIGNYKNCMEYHVGNDFLLIWIDKDEDTIHVVRIGTHSELFG